MESPSTTEVPIEDLQIIRAALNSGYHLCAVLDLHEQYRKLSQRPVASKLTLAVQNALTLTEAHIEVALTPEGEPDE